MTAQVIDGTAVARQVREDVAKGVEQLVAAGGTAPGLATVLIGDDAASEVYVRNKRRLCVAAGMRDLHRHLPGDIDQASASRERSTGRSCCASPAGWASVSRRSS